MSSPAADVSCRVAWADDALAIAGVQVRAWRASYADLLPDDLLAAMEPDEVAEAWRSALVTPGDARRRVLIALERNTVTGFALTSPAADPDLDPVVVGEVGELTIDPERQGHGHASRLMQACVDTLLADRFTRAVTWVTSADDARRTFLAAGGWQPDGGHRALDLHGDGAVVVRQVRLHVTIAG